MPSVDMYVGSIADLPVEAILIKPFEISLIIENDDAIKDQLLCHVFIPVLLNSISSFFYTLPLAKYLAIDLYPHLHVFYPMTSYKVHTEEDVSQQLVSRNIEEGRFCNGNRCIYLNEIIKLLKFIAKLGAIFFIYTGDKVSLEHLFRMVPYLCKMM